MRPSLGLTPDFNQQFLYLSEELASWVRKASIRIVPYRDSSLPHFSILPSEKKKEVLLDLQTHIQIYQQYQFTASDCQDLIRAAMKCFNLRMSDEDLKRIHENYIIEFYNLKHTQIFRNFLFYKFCSYTIEEMTSIPWFELFQRDQQHTDLIYKAFQKICDGSTTTTQALGLGPHWMTEAKSALKFEIECDLEYMIPMFDDQEKVAGCAVLATAKILNSYS